MALFAILQCISTYGRILNISFENAYIKDTHAKILLKVIDEVVANGDDSVDELLSRKFAWYNQEMQKGGYLVDLVPEAGWAFGANYMVVNKPLSETSRLYEELAKIVGTTNMEDAQ